MRHLLNNEANMMLRSAECRTQVASNLLGTIQGTLVSYEQEKYDLAISILKENLSLREIMSRLEGLKVTEERQLLELVDANAAIAQATAEISAFLDNTVGRNGREEQQPSPRFKLLDTKLGGESTAENDSSCASSICTDFEHIDAYCRPFDEEYENFDNNEDGSILHILT